MHNLTDTIRERYAEAARRVTGGAAATCGCGTATSACCDPISSHLYGDADAAVVPDTAFLASLGCGNPTALAHLNLGETVLDLGSGGGIDVILSARRVGPTGWAYGLDMTDEMLALAEDNKRKAGVANVEFLKGQIEQVPLPDSSVDVIISNCVINLSADKDRVLREAFRVLKPNGRVAVFGCRRSRGYSAGRAAVNGALGWLRRRRFDRRRVSGQARGRRVHRRRTGNDACLRGRGRA